MNAAAVAAPASVAKADDVATPPKTEAHGFAKQLENATKPVVKKPTIAIDQPPQAALEPTAEALAQIVAALVNTTSAPVVLPTVVDTVPVIADAVVQKAAATVAEAPEQTLAAIVQLLVVTKPEAAPEPPLTPLEQAVHDMLTELADHKEAVVPDVTMAQALQFAPTSIIAAPDAPIEIKQAAPLAAQQPQELVSQNHAHLVFDDPNGRIVMTVAIRGSEVNVSMRASDDSTAAALARNAGSLEEAMRGRGLQLAQFDAQRDLAREQREKPTYEKSTVKKSDGERFTLEENP